MTHTKLWQSRQPFAVFGRATLHQAEVLDEMTAPVGKTVGELEFQDDAIAKRHRRILHGRAKGCGGPGLGSHGAIQGDAHVVVHRILVGFAQVADVREGPGVNALDQSQEALDRHQRLGVAIQEMLRAGQMPGQQPGDGFLPDAPALFENAVVHAAFDFEKDR